VPEVIILSLDGRNAKEILLHLGYSPISLKLDYQITRIRTNS